MQRETALEVNEGLATPRAPASEDVLVDVSAGAHDFPLLFVQLRVPRGLVTSSSRLGALCRLGRAPTAKAQQAAAVAEEGGNTLMSCSKGEKISPFSQYSFLPDL